MYSMQTAFIWELLMILIFLYFLKITNAVILTFLFIYFKIPIKHRRIF